MKTVLTSTVFTLNPGEVAPLSVRTSQRLQVEDAAGLDLWVTRDNDASDYWLRRGCSLPIRAGEQLVLSVDPHAPRPVRIALISHAGRPAGSTAGQLLRRAWRRLSRGAQWSPHEDLCKAA